MIERTYISYWKDDIQCPDCGRYGRLDQFTGGIRDGCYVRALVCHGCYVQARRKLKRHKERICQNPACGITFTTTLEAEVEALNAQAARIEALERHAVTPAVTSRGS